MGLKPLQIVLLMSCLGGCATTKVVTPADDVKGHTWYYECCDPGIDQTQKFYCQVASAARNHTLQDTDNNQYVYVWTGCEVGKEPWQKYEDLKWRSEDGKSRQLDYPKAN